MYGTSGSSGLLVEPKSPVRGPEAARWTLPAAMPTMTGPDTWARLAFEARVVVLDGSLSDSLFLSFFNQENRELFHDFLFFFSQFNCFFSSVITSDSIWTAFFLASSKNLNKIAMQQFNTWLIQITLVFFFVSSLQLKLEVMQKLNMTMIFNCKNWKFNVIIEPFWDETSLCAS